MKYVSTRGGESVSPSLAILRGIAPNGGLYVPESIPSLSSEEFQALLPLSYAERAAKILGIFLTDFTQEELLSYTTAAYSAEKFPGGAAPPGEGGGGYLYFGAFPWAYLRLQGYGAPDPALPDDRQRQKE